ncbi:GH15 family glucan-1,4-alpha-glucosidase [Labedella gwakjiensis]|uniref:GH15 family glucan-1,4-alpha-glucosidase n=1 Tax=Labedella gwakjiensis TaxID=390269 RepID=A0A2P8GUC5_9MICO|nr:glycoside hydrolase family 15 protein [Labedella gwakjiensis]PSL37564.1 GH15 family glucan-1,4-alpha-glucosidase [Labedella gwakjiensis]RUQ84864.1 glycoside hydrolase family 15 protein [Labedella gwakjiensis]
MPLPIEDYALLGDSRGAALVGRDGSIDWLCVPRFDAAAVFSALLGDEEHGRWLLAPVAEATSTRSYEDGSIILRTRWSTADGEAETVEFMPTDGDTSSVVRRVTGISGTVRFRQALTVRPNFADIIPWVRQLPQRADAHRLLAIGGPDAILVTGPRLHADGNSHVGEFTVSAGETVDVVLTWYPSWQETPLVGSVDVLLAETLARWEGWQPDNAHDGPYGPMVSRSLTLLRALTHDRTGGIVAAATTSLPEAFGGERNWDYRYVWLRDASLTVSTLLRHGFFDEVGHWRSWLLRAIAGDPDDVQIMYGLAGERELPERVVERLPGYEGAAPVRTGNGAVDQFQADVLGEVLVCLDDAREAGLVDPPESWALQRALLKRLERTRADPDNGIWEIRGAQQHFVHSRAMVWAGFDRGVRGVRRYGLPGEAERWERLRDEVAADVATNGVSASHGGFTQYFGTDEVDAALLQLPQVGFCAYDDPRMLATVERIERDLMPDGFVLRYRAETGVDGVPGAENPFLTCSFWLVEQYARTGRRDDAEALMAKLLAVANDLGMLSEEYDPVAKRQAGNTPQALTHLALIRAADALGGGLG